LVKIHILGCNNLRLTKDMLGIPLVILLKFLIA
jgi:hypothetical protein